MLARVQEAVRRAPGCFVSPAIEARAIPRMGVGVVARDRVAAGSLLFQAGAAAWHPLSAECAVELAQRNAPGFVTQLQQLLAGSASLRASPFVPRALALAAHLLVNFSRGDAVDADTPLGQLYVAALPPRVDLPLLWDAWQLSELEGCCEAARSFQQSSQLYTTIHAHLFGAAGDLVARDAFLWAISVLMSRATSGTDQPFALVPFFDWFNHNDNGDECVQAFDPRSGFTVHATRAYEAGEQVFINYGHHSNLRLLRNYGFTLPTNAHDTLELPLPTALGKLAPADDAVREKLALLQALRLGDGAADGLPAKKTLQFATDGQLAAESQQWLQILLASRNELESLFHQVTAAPEPGAHSGHSLRLPESLRHKLRDRVRALCSERLATHKTPLETDESLLRESDRQLAPWLRSCLHIRMSEKRTLLNAIRLNAPVG
ncbi:hypothetical protein PybrP1_010201 [[Pythium] brassicae (nom. inval.)]|nr:hypothetical protein PybrP1_010201 [[Pythium] brassicae (nom. inval.)]